MFSFRRAVLLTAVFAAALAAVGSPISPAAAHERRTVAGTYTFVVGFITEPALLEIPNGIDLRITNSQTNEPVAGVEKTLKAEIIVGNESKTVDLKARFGQQGAYTAEVIPTRTGTWVFRFFGDIAGTPVNERFESGPGRFNDVQATSDLQFPVKVPTLGELAAATSRSNGAGEAGAQPAAPDVQQALDEAESAKNTATTFGVIGIATGLVGVALALWSLTRRRSTSVGAEPV